MTAFWAMLIDAYRHLNSRKLFWITLGISAIVVVYYASIGFTDTGMSMFFGLVNIESELLTRGSPLAALLYRSIFSSFIVGLWLAWVATILALISTTSIFPDFVAGGSIDLVLSKPIGRLRLFVIKYISSLLFVILQVAVFCVGALLCMGVRIGEWEWRTLLAIPVVTLFFSYLYSINVLVGVWTRSGLTALLVTLLAWFSLFGVTLSENQLNFYKTMFAVQVEEADEQMATLEGTVATATGQATGEGGDAALPRTRERLESMRTDREAKQDVIRKLDRWHRPVRVLQATLPKTSETIALLERWLKRDTDIDLLDLMQGGVSLGDEGEFHVNRRTPQQEAQRRVQDETEHRSLFYVIGSSLLFELGVLAVAALIFVRRDY